MLAPQIAHAACPSSGVTMIVLALCWMLSCSAVNRVATFASWSRRMFGQRIPLIVRSLIAIHKQSSRHAQDEIAVYYSSTFRTIASCWSTTCRCWRSAASVVAVFGWFAWISTRIAEERVFCATRKACFFVISQRLPPQGLDCREDFHSEAFPIEW